MEERDIEMGLEEELKELVGNHGERIQKLEVDMAGVKEKLNSVEGIVTRFETNYYQTSNSMLSTMSQLVVNTSGQNVDLTKTSLNNRKDIILNAIKIGGSIVGVLILGYFAMKGVTVSLPIF